MTTGERIRLLRERRGLSGVQLAARAGLDQSYLSKLERGKAGWSAEGLEMIARVLGVTSGTLLDGTMEPGGEPSMPKHGMVPIYDFNQVGSPQGSGGAFREEEIDSYIYSDLQQPRDLFGLIVRGPSMEPHFVEGDVVLFRRGLEPQPGDYVAASDPNRGGVFRRYRDLSAKVGEHIFALLPCNENYPTYRSDEGDWKLEGTLVRHIRDYRK